jgi:UDP-glucose 4-epimerase
VAPKDKVSSLGRPADGRNVHAWLADGDFAGMSECGGTVYGEPKYLPCDESHPVQPISPYGASKYTVDRYLAMYNGNLGLEYVAFRYPNVYGPRQYLRGEAGAVAIFTSRMLLAKQVVIFGGGEQTRDFLHVGDCVAANLMAIGGAAPNTVHNLGTGQGTSVNHIFETLQKITRYSQSAVFEPPKVGETR